MGFDENAFIKAEFTPRTEDVPVPELEPFFDEPTTVWQVRCLDGNELAKVNDSVTRARNLDGLIEAVTEGTKASVSDAVRELLGISGRPEQELAKRIDILHLGSVNPKIDRLTAVKLLRLYPEVGWRLSNKILELTGMGHQPGK